MISSILLCGSSYNKYKKISFIFYSIMLMRLLIGQINDVTNLFLLINLSLFAAIPLLINRVENKKIKTILSVFSIIIWSIIIDIICYYMFPKFVGGASLFVYVLRGLSFNSKYIITNTLLIACIELFEIVYSKILDRIKITKKEAPVNN